MKVINNNKGIFTQQPLKLTPFTEAIFLSHNLIVFMKIAMMLFLNFLPLEEINPRIKHFPLDGNGGKVMDEA